MVGWATGHQNLYTLRVTFLTLLIDIFFVHFSKNVRADSTILSEEKVQAIIEDVWKTIEIASNQLFRDIFGV